jgi:hypothetical protein
MFIYGIVVFLIFAVATSAASTVMKIQVNDRVLKDERFSWWSRDFTEVGRKYREFFPGSPLPDIAQYSGWICVLLFAAGVLSSFFER